MNDSYFGLPQFSMTVGDTFNVSILYAVDGLVPTDLTPYTLTSDVRDSHRNLINTLTITLADQITSPGLFYLSVASTQYWPIDLLWCDILFVLDGVSLHTTPFNIRVQEAITYA